MNYKSKDLIRDMTSQISIVMLDMLKEAVINKVTDMVIESKFGVLRHQNIFYNKNLTVNIKLLLNKLNSK